MTRVVCGVGESAATLDAVPAAVAFCRENRADLELVRVVRDVLTDTTRVTGGNKVLCCKRVKFEFDKAAEAAREAGLSAEIAVRAGDAPSVLIREAEEVGAGEVFYVQTRGRIRAALTGKPRAEIPTSRSRLLRRTNVLPKEQELRLEEGGDDAQRQRRGSRRDGREGEYRARGSPPAGPPVG